MSAFVCAIPLLSFGIDFRHAIQINGWLEWSYCFNMVVAYYVLLAWQFYHSVYIRAEFGDDDSDSSSDSTGDSEQAQFSYDSA